MASARSVREILRQELRELGGRALPQLEDGLHGGADLPQVPGTCTSFW